MKKIILSAALIAGLGVFAGSNAFAADGTITFNGQISDVTCTVHGGAPGNDSGDFLVTLPTVSTSAFQGVGTAAGSVPYSIFVGAPGETGCQDGTIVSVHYEPASPRVDPATGYLMLDPEADVATGVELRILNQDRSVINLATAPDSNKFTVANNQAELPFFAEYVSTAASVTPGSANSSVLYSIKYN